MTTTDSSTCILDAWDQCAHDNEICACAIAMLLLSQAGLVGQLNSLEAVEQCLQRKLQDIDQGAAGVGERRIWLLALAQIMTRTGRPAEADACYQRAIEAVATSSFDADEISLMADGVADLLEEAGQETAAVIVRRRLRAHVLIAAGDNDTLLELRELAFAAYQTAQYADAERIYRHLVSRNFETSGTHCHLARVLLAMGRDAEASGAVEAAWRMHADSPPFVIVRIHYLRGAVGHPGRPGRRGSSGRAPASALETPESHYSWLLRPLLDALTPRMAPESCEFFIQLADTLSDRTPS